MKYFNVTIVSLLTATFCFSQNKNLNFNRGLKIYNLSTYQKTRASYSDSIFLYSSSNSVFQILHPTIAYFWKGKKQNWNEVELTTLIMNKKADNYTNTQLSNGLPIAYSGADIFTTALSLRYEYIINFFKMSESKIATSLGFAINPYFTQIKNKPHTTQAFPTSMSNIGVRGFLIPRLTYYVSSKCFFDFNIPLAIFDGINSATTIRNPQIKIKSQRTFEGDFKILPQQFSLRLGVGIKI